MYTSCILLFVDVGHSEYPDKINLILQEIGIKVKSGDLSENKIKRSSSLQNIPVKAMTESKVSIAINVVIYK